mmetsp:Transcript_17445/g.36810  ORF Transcript_17445/g.36810 Transcript_17445/m.36810 type:complete len:260 (+) Transcript_17445:187-966(+)
MSKPDCHRSHYDILQISQTATAEEIKAAYRSLIIRIHPDKSHVASKDTKDQLHVRTSENLHSIDIDDDDDVVYESTSDNNIETETTKSEPINKQMNENEPLIANENEEESSTKDTTTFHRIQAAYHCLRDPNKRRQYDESISRKEERKEWKWKGAQQVALSEMEYDWCCVVDEENSDIEDDGAGQTTVSTDDDTPPLQKVFFHPCRCGDTFQIFYEELLESIGNSNNDPIDKNDTLTNRIWQCESCSLSIRIHTDIDID